MPKTWRAWWSCPLHGWGGRYLNKRLKKMWRQACPQETEWSDPRRSLREFVSDLLVHFESLVERDREFANYVLGWANLKGIKHD